MNEQTDTPRTQSFRDHLMGISPEGKIWGLFKWSENLERELTAARAELEEYKTAFTEMNQALGVEVEEVERLKLELTAVTERRDKLTEALNRIANNNVQDLPETSYAYEFGRMEGIAKIALQFLTTNEQ